MHCSRIIVLLGWVLPTAGGCLGPTPPVIALSEKVRLPAKSAVIFFVDGMALDRMNALLEGGALPNIRKYFVEGGVGVEFAVASMPAITYPNSVSLLTGCFPGHHDIMGNIWFDRRTLEIRDYSHADSYRSVNQHFNRQTLYEILEDHFSVNVQCHTRRGVSHIFDNLLPTGLDWYTHNFSAVDERVGSTFGRVIALANRRRRWPTVMTFYFPGVDEVGHRYGSDSERYAAALGSADRAIGVVCEAIQASTLAERTYFVLTTDHGHVPTPANRHFDLARWFERQYDLKIRTERLKSESYDRRQRQLAQSDLILFTDAGRRAVVHLPGPSGWSSLPGTELVDGYIDELVQLPAVGLAVRRVALLLSSAEPEGDFSARQTALVQAGGSLDSVASSRVQIRSRGASAVVERRVSGTTVLYRLHSRGGDPLGYLDDPKLRAFVEGGWHDSRSWLAATADTLHPDFVPQVVEMFDSPRAGDIVLFAAEDWAFDTWNSGHGSSLAGDMRVPMYFAGPDLAHGGQIDCARNVDIMPTVLDLLGEAHRLGEVEPIDGQSLAEELRSAGNSVQQSTASPVDSGQLLSDAVSQSPDLRRRLVEPLGLD